MKTARTDLLCGTPENVAAVLEALSLAQDLKEYVAGTQLRSLAAELARNPDLRVSVITYDNESQDIEVRLAHFPESVPVTVDRNGLGDKCQITCDCWQDIGTADAIVHAAGLVIAILRGFAEQLHPSSQKGSESGE
jgi:putative heme iron utilization protein